MFKKTGFVVILASLLLAACSDKEKVMDKLTEPVIEPVKAEETEEVLEEVEILYNAPFTGIGFKEENKQRPVLVTVNNHPLARPQSGLAQADIVYEMLAEGNVTRFLALYQSEMPEVIGPVRSARDYFVTIAKGLDAFYIAHGYSPEAKDMLAAQVVDNINGMQYDGILFNRSKERKAPHNSYISKENIIAGADKVGASMKMAKAPVLSFYDSLEGAKIGDMASSVSIRYGSSASFENQYTYLPEEGLYERTSGGVLTTDKESEEPIQIANVIFMEMAHKTIDDKGRQELALDSGGKAYLFQAGVMKEIEWENIDGMLIPMEEGVPAKLVKGKSWISFVPTNPGLEKMVNYLP